MIVSVGVRMDQQVQKWLPSLSNSIKPNSKCFDFNFHTFSTPISILLTPGSSLSEECPVAVTGVNATLHTFKLHPFHLIIMPNYTISTEDVP